MGNQQRRPGEGATFLHGGVRLEDERGPADRLGGRIGPLRGPKPFVTFYVVVRDLAATLKKATDGGGKVVFPVTKVGPTTTIAIFSDPDGNIIGLTDGK